MRLDGGTSGSVCDAALLSKSPTDNQHSRTANANICLSGDFISYPFQFEVMWNKRQAWRLHECPGDTPKSLGHTVFSVANNTDKHGSPFLMIESCSLEVN